MTFFLVRLNAAIGPILVQGTTEDSTVYVSIFRKSSNVSWNASNPFGISNYVLDHDLVSGFVYMMQNMKR